ncbi:MAG: glycosyltransferase [Balneolaceae bacterium]|nr:glycosyltransferase [Balneolaceae bacterium]
MESKLLEEIPVIEIEPPFDRTTSQKNKSESAKKESPFLDWLDKQTPLDSWIYLFVLKYFEIRKKVKKIDPDIIWATGDPWSGLWLGEKLARSFSKPFIADFRDPWTAAEVHLRTRSPFSLEIDKQVEKRILQNANRVVFTSGLTEKKYLDEFKLPKQKTKTIYNSFDSSLIKEYESETWGEELNPEYLNLIFFGRFRRLSPVTPIADALRELKSKNAGDASNIHIHSFGKPDARNLRRIREYGLEKNFIFHEPVVPEKMLPVLKSADILLLSTNMEREQVIPAKLWDYLSVKVPILSITPNPEVGDIVMRSKAGIQVHPDEKKEIAELLQSFARAKQNEESFLLSPEKEIPDRNMYEAKHTSGELASLFDELLTNG